MAPALTGFAGWLLKLLAATRPVAQPPISDEERRATLAALRPPKRERPLVAIVGINDATETTDYLLPDGVTKATMSTWRSGRRWRRHGRPSHHPLAIPGRTSSSTMASVIIRSAAS